MKTLHIFALCALALPLPLGAQQADSTGAEAACSASVPKSPHPVLTNSCFQVANAGLTRLIRDAFVKIQPRGSGAAAPAGTPAQTSAVPTVQPTALAAVSVAATSQDSGAETIAAASINPLALFSTSKNPATIMKLTRLADLTVFYPTGGLDQNKDGHIDYLGAQMRINLGAFSQVQALRDTAAVNAGVAAAKAELGLLDEMTAMLLKAPDTKTCAAKLVDTTSKLDDWKKPCGMTNAVVVDTAIYHALLGASESARQQADRDYWGFDLRYDVGDPTFGKTHDAAGKSAIFAAAGGHTFAGSTSGAGVAIRARLGARYIDLRDTTLTEWEVDGGLALAATRPVGDQQLEVSAGVEFRYGANKTAAQMLQSRYAELRLGLTLPITSSSSIAIGFSTPLAGMISPTLSVSGNWQQLLAAITGH